MGPGQRPTIPGRENRTNRLSKPAPRCVNLPQHAAALIPHSKRYFLAVIGLSPALRPSTAHPQALKTPIPPFPQALVAV